MKRVLAALLALAALGLASEAAAQTPTRVRVRVVSHDAKIIGSGVGGARISVRDAATGAVLAQGVQQGLTGHTRAIVVEPVERGAAIYDTEGSAELTFELSLSEPTVLEFVGEGPLGYEHAMQRASKTMLLLPGEDVLGNGVVLELHGFIVELLEPAEALAGGADADVLARVRMMCGCPLEPGGLWDADRVEVRAQVWAGDRLLREAPLPYAGETNMFRGPISLEGAPGGARLMVIATDPTRQNFGRSQALVLN